MIYTHDNCHFRFKFSDRPAKTMSALNDIIQKHQKTTLKRRIAAGKGRKAKIRLCLLSVFALALILTACGGSGHIILDGRYVLSSSGRSYVVYEPETDIPHFVKIEAREGSDITFDKLQTGDLIKTYVSAFREHVAAGEQGERITLLHTTVSYCEKKGAGTENDIPADLLKEIETADMIWDDSENNQEGDVP